MAHYAFINEHNIVLEVIAGKDETDTSNDWEQVYSEARGLTCKRTSYNGNIRKNYAGIGYTYDEQRDAFIPPKPFESWTLDEETCRWVAPKPYPSEEKLYVWVEALLDWVEPVQISE